jgi:hypothetical protein
MQGPCATEFFMAMLAFEDDSHFEREAEIAIFK